MQRLIKLLTRASLHPHKERDPCIIDQRDHMSAKGIESRRPCVLMLAHGVRNQEDIV